MEDQPKTAISTYNDDEMLITAHLVWIYPHSRINQGARVVYFRSNSDKKIVCYIHHHAPSSDVLLPDDELYICEVAVHALFERGIAIMEDYDIFSDFDNW